MKTIFTLICVALLASCNHTQKDETGTKGLVVFQDSNGNYGFKDSLGKIVIQADDENSSLGGYNAGLANIEINGKGGFVDKTGKEIE